MNKIIRFFIIPLFIILLFLSDSMPAVDTAIGVCPFLNINKNNNYDWVCDGIPESLTSDMKLANLLVVERLHLKILLRR